MPQKRFNVVGPAIYVFCFFCVSVVQRRRILRNGEGHYMIDPRVLQGVRTCPWHDPQEDIPQPGRE